MELSMFYQMEVLQLPEGMKNWVCLIAICEISQNSKLRFFEQDEYAIQLNDQEPGYDWEDGEEQVCSS